MSLTVEKKSKYRHFVSGAQLEATDRAILSLIYQHAHDSGCVLDPRSKRDIPLSSIRQSFSKHKGTDELRESLERLSSVKVKHMAEAVR